MAGRPKEFNPQEALGAATEVFWECGFEGVGMERLLKEMGVSRQSAYDTFGGKREIFLKALGAYIGRVEGDVTAVLRGEGSPVERVQRFLARVRDKTSKRNERGCLITNTIVELGPHDAEVRKIVSGVMRGLEDLLTEVLTDAKKAGEIPKQRDPRKLARLIVVTFEGALVMSKTEQAGSVQDALALLEEMIVGQG